MVLRTATSSPGESSVCLRRGGADTRGRALTRRRQLARPLSALQDPPVPVQPLRDLEVHRLVDDPALRPRLRPRRLSRPAHLRQAALSPLAPRAAHLHRRRRPRRLPLGDDRRLRAGRALQRGVSADVDFRARPLGRHSNARADCQCRADWRYWVGLAEGTRD